MSLPSTATALADRCVDGIQANRHRCLRYAQQSPGVVAALVPVIGYDAAAEVVKQALAQHVSVAEVVRGTGVVPLDRVDAVLDALSLTQIGRA